MVVHINSAHVVSRSSAREVAGSRPRLRAVVIWERLELQEASRVVGSEGTEQPGCQEE